MSLWLSKDQRSNEVVALQNALNLRLNRTQPLALDGVFGSHTEAAVHDFQKCEGLKVDGIAGPKTLGALFVRRTVVNRFYVKVASPPLPTTPGFVQGAASLAGSPYDPPQMQREMPSYEEQVRAWLAHPMPKPALPTPAPGCCAIIAAPRPKAHRKAAATGRTAPLQGMGGVRIFDRIRISARRRARITSSIRRPL